MHGTTSQRVGRLLRHLVLHPSRIYPYCRYSLFRQTPVQQELPWIAWESIAVLRNSVTDNTKVFEYGTGGSTLFFARRGAQVYAVENDENWAELVTRRLAAEKLSDRVSIHYLPFEPDLESYRKSDYLHAVERGMWDVVFIDGFTDYSRYRPDCLDISWRHLNSGGLIVFDDIWMFPETRERILSMGGDVHRDTGPSRYGITETAVLKKPA